MGLLQEAYAKYVDNPNVLIFAIAVDTVAWEIDVEEVRDRASCKGWTMPIVKDLDNSSQGHFYIDIPRWGRNPSSTSVFALDLSGKIIAHNTASNERMFKKVLKAFEKEVEKAEETLVPDPLGLDARFEALKALMMSGDYGEAYTMLEKLEGGIDGKDSEKALDGEDTEGRKRDASLSDLSRQVRYVKALLENSFDRRWKGVVSHWLFDPPSAVSEAETLFRTFGGAAQEGCADQIAVLKSSPEYEEYGAMQKRYDSIHQQIATLGDDASEKKVQSIRAALEQLTQDALGTKIENLAHDLLKSLQ